MCAGSGGCDLFADNLAASTLAAAIAATPVTFDFDTGDTGGGGGGDGSGGGDDSFTDDDDDDDDGSGYFIIKEVPADHLVLSFLSNLTFHADVYSIQLKLKIPFFFFEQFTYAKYVAGSSSTNLNRQHGTINSSIVLSSFPIYLPFISS